MYQRTERGFRIRRAYAPKKMLFFVLVGFVLVPSSVLADGGWGAPLIHWVPAETGIPCEVTLRDPTAARGIAEDTCRQLKSSDVGQFKRFGFVRVDSVNWKL